MASPGDLQPTTSGLATRAGNGALAGIVGGIVFGILMTMMDMLPMVGMLIGVENAFVGFLVDRDPPVRQGGHRPGRSGKLAAPHPSHRGQHRLEPGCPARQRDLAGRVVLRPVAHAEPHGQPPTAELVD